jgi:ATP adenylyltransferase
LRYYRAMSEQTDSTRSESFEAGQGQQERLWTPWRMRYVVGGTKEAGCIFCNRLARADDVASLIIHREADAFVIMNLYPYNTAHLMIVPTVHVSSPESAPEQALARLGTLLQPVTRALRRVLRCDGFNVGFNVGAVAGAGVEEHLHQHVVPRWTGDASFMPILAGTMVLPELIPVSYAKVRAELRRELLPADAPQRDDVRVVATSSTGEVLLQASSEGRRLPRFRAEADLPLWRAALHGVSQVIAEPEIVGWAGARSTLDDLSPVLRLVGQEIAIEDVTGIARASRSDAVRSLVDDEERTILTAALAADPEEQRQGVA